jgi:hypothetical protein
MKAPMLLALAGLSMAAQSSAPTGTLTLACEGTRTDTDMKTQVAEKPEPVSMGIIVDFETQRVQFGDDTLRISAITETLLHFEGNNFNSPKAAYSYSIDGTIDRMAGTADAKSVGTKSGGQWAMHWLLQCKPTQRTF